MGEANQEYMKRQHCEQLTAPVVLGRQFSSPLATSFDASTKYASAGGGGMLAAGALSPPPVIVISKSEFILVIGLDEARPTS